MAAPKQTDPQFKLRMPQSLKDDLEAAVESSGRTLNAEIIWRLEQSFAVVEAGMTDEAVGKAMIDRMQEIMGSVIEDMREEQKLTNGLHLLLKWFADNPEERAEYEELPEDEREEFAREKTHSLWIEYLNDKRANRQSKIK